MRNDRIIKCPLVDVKKKKRKMKGDLLISTMATLKLQDGMTIPLSQLGVMRMVYS